MGRKSMVSIAESPGRSNHLSRMVSLTKISSPNPMGIVPRERVFQLIDDAMKHPVVWISGPAGSGKTSLVSSYLAARKLPSLWYRVDAGDADIASFFYYLGLGAGKATPELPKSLPLLTPEYILGIPVFTRRFFEALYMRLTSPFVLVLDNYQEVPVPSQFHEIVNIALASVPEGIHVVVISRNAPPGVFARLRANNLISHIGWEDIRFTEEDAKTIIQEKVQGALSDATLSLLHKKTEGWIAGLILVVESLRLQAMDRREPAIPARNDIFDYFANEIFQKADRQIQTFLLKTAFFPTMTAFMAQGLTDVEAADRILQTLTENNYFTEKRLGQSAAYLYHPLFREFLLSRALETFTPDEISAIQRKAADLLIDCGQTEDASLLLIQAQDWAELVRLILGQAPSLMTQGRHRTLSEWLGRIPRQIVENTPWLLYWKGICTLPFAPSESRACLEQAFRLFDLQGVEAGTFLAWSGAVQTYLYEFHEFKPVDQWTDWLDTRMGKDIHFPSAEIAGQVAAAMVGALAWRRPNHPDMKMWVNQALSFAQDNFNTDTALRACTNSTFYYLWMGDFADCGILMDQIRKSAPSRSSSPARQIALKIAEAMYANSLAERREEAARSVTEGIDIADKTGVHVLDAMLFIQGVCSALNENDLVKAKRFLSKMEGFTGNRRTNTGYFYYFSAWHDFLCGDLPRAVVAAQKSLELIEESGVPVSEALIRLMLAQVLKEAGDDEQACRQLAFAGKIAEETGSSYLAYLHSLAEAYVAFGLKNDPNGLEKLRRGLSLGRQKGFVTIIYFWHPDIMCTLCMKALAAGIEVAYVQNLVRKLNLVPQAPALEIETWPWPVKIHTLGRFDLFIDGMPIKKNVKAQKKPLLLLKALIALGACDVKEEQITDILWPDADGDAGHNAFTTTLARLRRLLSDERAVSLSDGRLSLDKRLCWVDRWSFEQLFSQAQALSEKDPATDPIALKQVVTKAAALYQGNFLHSDADQSWTITIRERLRTSFFRLIDTMGRYCRQTGDYEGAARYYQKGLESDPLAEVFYQGLMTSYICQGRRAEALAVYRQCSQVLNAELGLSPSPEIEALRDKIL